MSSDRLNVKVVSNQNSVELTKNENTVVISDKNRNTSINVLQKETSVVTVASKGPKGDKGDKGDTGIAVTNQIATGSITASVDVGANTFRVQSGSSTYFYISSSGNVGIGTTTPTNTLQVNGGITATYLTTSYIDINTTAGITQPIEGRLSWDNTDGTLDIGLKGGNISLQVGQEQVVRVVNKTDGNLLKSEYKVVRIRRTDEGGAQGQRLAIRLSQANNDPNSVDTLGLVAEDINDNQEGYIITSGLLHNINTTGTLQSETWYDGDVLYLSPTVAGALTNIKPIAPNHTVIVGFVVYKHNNQGKIFVKVDNGYEIDELHNVRINTSSLAVGDLLIYSSSVWINSKQMTGSYSLTGSLNVTSGITGSLFGTSSWAINALTASFVNTASTNAFVQNGNSFGTTALLGTNDNQNLQLETSGSVRMTISSSGNVGIGTSNPLSLLHITASSGNEFLRITSGSQNILNVRSGSAVFFAGTGVAPSSGVDLDIQGTGTVWGGSVRIAGNGTAWGFGSVSSVNRSGTGNSDMFNVSMTGTSATLVQNPMSITFNANQSTTGGGGYTVLRVNATHATTAGTGSKLLQTWEFGGTQRSVVNITGSIGVGITTPSASIHISSSLGLAPILAITPHHPLPTTNIPTGSFMVSSSTPPKPFFWDGTTWNALY